jgi:hypothetical protein
MADKRISQLVERTDIANNDVVPIVASGASTTNKATISSIQEFMQENLDVGVTSVGISLGTTGTDVSVSGSPITTSGNITINIPTASATNRGLLSSADWTTFNNKQAAGNYVTTDTTQTITGEKTFSGSSLKLAANGTANAVVLRNVSGTTGSDASATTLGFNGSNNIFVSTQSKGGFILDFSNSVSNRIYTLKDASGTLAFTSDITNALTGFVTLDTAQSITGTKTFTNSILLKNSPSLAGLILQSFSPNALEVGATISGTTYYSSITFPAGAQNWNLPNTSGTIALTSDLAGYVTLGTVQTITGQKTFNSTIVGQNATLTSSGSGQTLLVTHSSGSGIALDISKGGNGEGLRVAKTSGSGNAVTITGGLLSAEAATFTGALNGTSASFGGQLTMAYGGTPRLILQDTDSGAGNVGILFKENTTDKWTIASVSNSLLFFNEQGAGAGLTLSSTNAATFSSSVGIGGVVATDYGAFRQLAVFGGSTGGGITIASTGTATGVLTFANGTSGTNQFKGIIEYQHATDNMVFGTNATERMRITSSGELLVGTANNSPSAGHGLKNYADGRIYCVSSATSNASESYGMYSTGASNYRFYVGWGGTIFATNPIISSISDIRVKENIRDLDSGLDKIMALKPRVFDWKEGKGKDIKNDRGFIAQEFQEVFPDLIDEYKQEVEEGEEPYKSVRADLIPVLVKAIQELKTEIDSLKNQIK